MSFFIPDTRCDCVHIIHDYILFIDLHFFFHRLYSLIYMYYKSMESLRVPPSRAPPPPPSPRPSRRRSCAHPAGPGRAGPGRAGLGTAGRVRVPGGGIVWSRYCPLQLPMPASCMSRLSMGEPCRVTHTHTLTHTHTHTHTLIDETVDGQPCRAGGG